ncbi:MAG: hypothetical protein AAF125_21660, partial [Chloroflexota bacterium]
ITGVNVGNINTVGRAALWVAFRSRSPTRRGPSPVKDGSDAPTESAAVPVATAEQSNIQLVTPTLLPSKTPTVTPSQTAIPTITTTPTTTVTASPTATDDQFTLNAAVQASIAQATASVQGAGTSPNPFNSAPSYSSAVAAQCTGTQWFFTAYAPPTCPSEQPITGSGVFQRFEAGYMLWLEHNDKIYVVYNTAQQPRWQIFDDPYIEGEPELDYAWFTKEFQPPQTWQPRRGFGEVWRGREDVRFRIGWTVQEWETVYNPRFQRGEDGSVSIEHPSGGLFYLAPRGQEWYLYLDR